MGQINPYMANSVQRPIINACRLWLRPVARWLLRSGVTWKEFADLSREVYVQTATDEFGLRGRPTNVSRVALLTGLARREVRRIRDESRQPATSSGEEALNHASRVLSGWHLDADFLETDGTPRVLAASGGPASFDVLLKRYAGDIPTTALVKELIKSGSIERAPDGTYRVLRRYYMPRAMDGFAVERSGSVLADLATTIEHNLSRTEREPSRFEGRAQNPRIDPHHLPAFRAFMEREAQAMLERVDDWLTAHEAPPTAEVVPLRLGVGVYAIHDSISGETT